MSRDLAWNGPIKQKVWGVQSEDHERQESNWLYTPADHGSRGFASWSGEGGLGQDLDDGRHRKDQLIVPRPLRVMNGRRLLSQPVSACLSIAEAGYALGRA